jgi:hypothetical protein
MTTPTIFATSLDGKWTFDGSHIISATTKIESFTIDFFERWTFARFLPGCVLALGFESGQPWSEYGSYGSRYGGVQVLALNKQRDDWSLVAIEYDCRSFDETFVPDDVIWHHCGVFAWLVHGGLQVLALQKPRGIVPWDLLPACDGSQPLRYRYEFIGDWRRLDLSADGTKLTATDKTGMELFDLVQMRRSRDGSTWESWDEYGRIE